MHELSVCRGMLGQVEQLARQRGARSVSRIVLRIGPLSGIEPALLRQAFPFAAATTLAAHAKLVIEQPTVRVQCGDCGGESEAMAAKLVCRSCGSHRTRLLSGDEMLLVSIDLEQDESAQGMSYV